MKLPEVLSNRRTMLAIAIVVIVIVAAVGAAVIYARKGSNGGNGGNDHPEPVLAEAGSDVTGSAGMPVKFNGNASTGPITDYWWDFSRLNVTDPLRHEGSGKAVEHVFEDPGVYLVTLVVEGKGGKNSSDTLSAYINLNENKTGTVSPTRLNETYEWQVKAGLGGISLKLTFPTGNAVVGPPWNDADILVYVGASTTPLYTTTSQLPNPQKDPQEKTLDVPVGQVQTAGGFRVAVQYRSSELATPTIAFTLAVLLDYSP
jgi:PKD repeat protein